jgi:hypothetical protein
MIKNNYLLINSINSYYSNKLTVLSLLDLNGGYYIRNLMHVVMITFIYSRFRII